MWRSKILEQYVGSSSASRRIEIEFSLGFGTTKTIPGAYGPSFAHLGITSRGGFIFRHSWSLSSEIHSSFLLEETVSHFSFDISLSITILSGLTSFPSVWFRLLSIANLEQRNIICPASSCKPLHTGQVGESCSMRIFIKTVFISPTGLFQPNSF